MTNINTKLDLLLLNFAGELVSVTLNKDIQHTKQTEEFVETMTSVLTVNGYLIDVDDSFLYLGYEEDQIAQAINRNFVINVELAEEAAIESLMEDKKPGEFN